KLSSPYCSPLVAKSRSHCSRSYFDGAGREAVRAGMVKLGRIDAPQPIRDAVHLDRAPSVIDCAAAGTDEKNANTRATAVANSIARRAITSYCAVALKRWLDALARLPLRPRGSGLKFHTRGVRHAHIGTRGAQHVVFHS